MARAIDGIPIRVRISVDVEPEFRRRLRLAAAQSDVTVREYVLGAIRDRLRQDSDENAAPAAILTAATDPVLAELWSNEHDAAYDRI